MTPPVGGARERVHVVAGPDRHGVTEHSAWIARALRAPVVRLPTAVVDPTRLPPPGVPVHLGFTDRIWGRTPEAAADAVTRVCAGRDASVTLHDLPQASDGPGSLARRVDCYRRVVAAASTVVVSSAHEADLLAEAGIPCDPAVVPLPIPPLPVPSEPALPGLDRAVVVFGFLYPGKGHEEVLRALGALDGGRLVALGECSDGHADLAGHLVGQGASLGVEVAVSGYVPERRLAVDLAAAAVPAAPHRHVSASGSIASWLAAGRRPLVAENRYTRELAARLPGAVVLVPDDGWEAAIATAFADPDSTRLPAPLVRGPDEVAAGYRRVWAGAV